MLRICQNFHLMAVIVKKLDNRMKNDRKTATKTAGKTLGMQEMGRLKLV